MHLFLCGGGSGSQTQAAYEVFGRVVRPGGRLLYVPLAMESRQYPDCLRWITEEMSSLPFSGIDMVVSGDDLAGRDLADYSAVFIGGGNTFKLLRDLKESGSLFKLNACLKEGGVVFGGSAGAIIFGRDLDACRLDDPNEVGLTDASGFDCLNGASLLCHYTDRTEEQDRASTEYLLKLSDGRTLFALPEAVTLYLHDGRTEAIGGPYYRFENGVRTIVNE